MKYSVFAAAAAVTVSALLAGCSEKTGGLTPVALKESFHSVFYAPQYAAMELGFFKEEGIDLELINSSDNSMESFFSDEAPIVLSGPEILFFADQNSPERAVCFAQLAQRAGNVLVSRFPDEAFSWDKMKGKTVLGDRKGSMPEMMFELILKKHGINPAADLNILYPSEPGQQPDSFEETGADFMLLSEPQASITEQKGAGYIAAFLGAESGYAPTAVYCARKSFILEHPDTIQSFTNAVQKGLDYVNSHSASEIAAIIQPAFPDTDQRLLAAAIEHFKLQNTWTEHTLFEEESFHLLENILEESGIQKSHVPWEDLATAQFSREALN